MTRTRDGRDRRNALSQGVTRRKVVVAQGAAESTRGVFKMAAEPGLTMAKWIRLNGFTRKLGARLAGGQDSPGACLTRAQARTVTRQPMASAVRVAELGLAGKTVILCFHVRDRPLDRRAELRWSARPEPDRGRDGTRREDRLLMRRAMHVPGGTSSSRSLTSWCPHPFRTGTFVMVREGEARMRREAGADNGVSSCRRLMPGWSHVITMAKITMDREQDQTRLIRADGTERVDAATVRAKDDGDTNRKSLGPETTVCRPWIRMNGLRR